MYGFRVLPQYGRGNHRSDDSQTQRSDSMSLKECETATVPRIVVFLSFQVTQAQQDTCLEILRGDELGYDYLLP